MLPVERCFEYSYNTAFGAFRKPFDAKAGSGDMNVPGDGNGGNCVIRTGSGDIDIVIEN